MNSLSIYFENIKKSKLLTKGEEIQYAIIIRFALYQMLSLMLKNKSALERVVALVKYTKFEDCSIKKVLLIRKKYDKYKLSKKQDDLLRLEEECISFCFLLHIKEIKNILSKHRQFLVENDKETYKKFIYWENVYNQTKQFVVKANVRFVILIAKKFMDRGLDLEDLIQEGNKGLITAVENFDYRKGNKFSTYAIWWIKQTIMLSLHQNKTISMPINLLDFSFKIEKYTHDFQLKNGYEPSIEQIAKFCKCSHEKIEKVFQHTLHKVFLDAKVNDDNESITFLEHIADTSIEDAFAEISFKEIQNKIKFVIDSLRPKEKKVILMRFGLEDGVAKTLSEIGSKIGVSVERTRQIELKALKKLRNFEITQQFI